MFEHPEAQFFIRSGFFCVDRSVQRRVLKQQHFVALQDGFQALIRERESEREGERDNTMQYNSIYMNCIML